MGNWREWFIPPWRVGTLASLQNHQANSSRSSLQAKGTAGVDLLFGSCIKTCWQQVAENLDSPSLTVRRFIFSQSKLSLGGEGSRQGTSGLWTHFIVALSSTVGFASSAPAGTTCRDANVYRKRRCSPLFHLFSKKGAFSKSTLIASHLTGLNRVTCLPLGQSL